MRRVIWTALAAATAVATMGLSGTASASTVVTSSCDPVTDGDTAGCLFSGNINENPDPTNVNGYKNAEAAYNVWAIANANPTILLNWITASDDVTAPGVFADFGTITGGGTSSGTFNLPGWDVDYFAVKAGNEFVLYEFLGAGGSGNWQVASGKDLSHLAFFGTRTAVPEPGTWAMMLIGFGAAGSTLRRRKPTARKLLQVA